MRLSHRSLTEHSRRPCDPLQRPIPSCAMSGRDSESTLTVALRARGAMCLQSAMSVKGLALHSPHRAGRPFLISAPQSRRPGNPPAHRIGTPIPGPGRIGKRGFPASRPNRETGIPSPFGTRQKKKGDSRFPSDVRASTAVDSEYTQPRASCQCSHRQHAAPTQGPISRGSMLLRVTSINRSGKNQKPPT